MKLIDLGAGQKFVLYRTGRKYILISHNHEKQRTLVKPVGWVAKFYPSNGCTLNVQCQVTPV